MWKSCDICYQNSVKVTVPIHGKRDLGKGLLKQIMKDAGLTNEDIVS
jgi:predicted RNA binding protein YcfA (HicA-like mRNA interferase family)